MEEAEVLGPGLPQKAPGGMFVRRPEEEGCRARGWWWKEGFLEEVSEGEPSQALGGRAPQLSRGLEKPRGRGGGLREGQGAVALGGSDSVWGRRRHEREGRAVGGDDQTQASGAGSVPEPPIISARLKRAGSTSSLSASSERPRERHLSVGFRLGFRHTPGVGLPTRAPEKRGAARPLGREGDIFRAPRIGSGPCPVGFVGFGPKSKRAGPHGAQSAGICGPGVRVFGFAGRQRRCGGDSSHHGRVPARQENAGGGSPQGAGFPGACPGPAPERTVLES
ncbi:translation initiation factor IF-2-like [Mustela erminea]|uniref:translation initiation factor IF-2-like n=1 Tax=Mustela erminea TaxID=36723 RepID=UPI0013875A37|nr:translation initiation factor IF-2-like [Mustela erminea]